MILHKTCPVCQQPFETSNKLKVYCSLRCKYKAKYRKSRERPSFTIVCKTCGSAFQAPQRNRKYCSQACREARAPERMDPLTLVWLEKRSVENLVLTFQKEITAVSNGASPEGLLPFGPRRRLKKCGVLRLNEGRGRSLKLTPKGKQILATAEETPHDKREGILRIEGVDEK
jgi:predicted nucleic acid-binding Zn ribbon protein